LSSNRGFQVLIFLSLLLLGYSAFLFKSWDQRWYGVGEVCFGIFSGGNIAFSLRSNGAMFGHWAALVGCVYVIARGLNNIHEARAKLAGRLH
jgi:hypothetical protein